MSYKTIITILLVALTLAFSASAEKTACYNQDGKPYCVPEDSTCTLHMDGVPEASDADGDGWSDGCDAFSDNGDEWFDLDGDGDGHNCDVNDFDRTVGCEDPVDPEPVQDPSVTTTTTTSTSSGGSSGSGGGGGGGRLQLQYEWTCTDWSPCAPEGVQTRTCTQVTNYAGTWQKPAEEQACEYEEPAGSGQTTPTNSGGNDNGGNSLPIAIPVVEPPVPPITGAAVGPLAGPVGATVGVLLLIVILALVWASWKYTKGKPILNFGKFFS